MKQIDILNMIDFSSDDRELYENQLNVGQKKAFIKKCEEEFEKGHQGALKNKCKDE